MAPALKTGKFYKNQPKANRDAVISIFQRRVSHLLIRLNMFILAANDTTLQGFSVTLQRSETFSQGEKLVMHANESAELATSWRMKN